jgi:tetratricopeptide (TPR) repeat protein
MRSLFASSQWLALVGLTVLVVGCKKKVPDPESAGAAPAMVHTGAPLTEDDCKAFGEKLETAVAAGDTAEVNRLLRINDLIERSVGDLGLTASEKKSLLAGAARAGGQFADLFIKVVKEGGSYSVLRVRTADGRPRVLLRLIHGEGAVNYHEFTLVRYPDQQIAAEDIYIYVSGEPLTQTFRRIVLGFLAELNKGAVVRLTGEEQVLTKHMGDITQMTAMVRNGQNKEALAVFRKLPAEIQKNKVFQIMAVQAAGGTGDENDYLTEMERFRKNHPHDAAGDIVSIDYYLLKKNYDEMFKAIDRLDKSLGGDPYLDAMRAGGLIEAGRLKEARAAAEKAIEGAPKLPQAYWMRTTVAAKEKDHADTLACLKALVENAEPALDPGNLPADERFAEFVKTPQFDEFKKWVAARAK